MTTITEPETDLDRAVRRCYASELTYDASTEVDVKKVDGFDFGHAFNRGMAVYRVNGVKRNGVRTRVGFIAQDRTEGRWTAYYHTGLIIAKANTATLAIQALARTARGYGFVR